MYGGNGRRQSDCGNTAATDRPGALAICHEVLVSVTIFPDYTQEIEKEELVLAKDREIAAAEQRLRDLVHF